MPDDLLSPLGDGPVPPLAPAADVRARGDQRRRRARAALAGTGALAVVLALGGGYALISGDQGRDSIVTTPGDGRPGTPQYDENGCLVLEPEEPGGVVPAVCIPSPSAAPTPASSTAASTAPSPALSSTPAATPLPDADGVLLSVADVDRVEPGDWETSSRPDDGPLLDPCAGGTAYPRDADVLDQASIVLIARREAGGTDISQTVSRYPSAEVAADALDGYRRAVEGCPRRETGEPPAVVTHEVLGTSASDFGARVLVVRLESGCGSDGPCVGGYAYYAVHQVGAYVSVVAAGMGEDGDPGLPSFQPFFDAARDRLVRTV